MKRLIELYRTHRWAGRSIIALSVLAAIVASARLSLPNTIIYAAERWLGSQGVDTQIEDIILDIYNGEFTLLGASGRSHSGETFRIDRVAVVWSWSPLRNKTVQINAVDIKGVALNVYRYADGFDIGGIRIDTAASTEAAVEEPAAGDEKSIDWAAALTRITVSDIHTCFASSRNSLHDVQKAHDLHYCADLQALEWNGEITFNKNNAPAAEITLPLNVRGMFSLEGIEITNRLLDRTLLGIAGLELRGIELTGPEKIGFDTLGIDRLRLLQDPEARAGHIALLERIEIEGASLGRLSDLSLAAVRLTSPTADYRIASNGAGSIDPWLKATPSDHGKSAGTTAGSGDAAAAPIRITLNDIGVTTPDLCYRDEKNGLDYCLLFDSLKWTGTIRYGDGIDTGTLPLALDGNLGLEGLKLNNHALGRELLVFDAFSLTGIASEGLDAKLAGASLRGLNIMQSAAGKDAYTAGFDTLDISSVDYKHMDSISIDTITLGGLGSHISKDKSGELNFAEWLPETPDRDRPAADKTDEPAQAIEPMAVRINTIRLHDSDILRYTDMTTTPVMDVGLRKLNLQIDNIDSHKPGQESPLKLSAATLRHGTVSIDGHIKPFDTKFSIDANGKVRGIDMRAFSPLTQQQIGHIIRSGQLDADLRLLAKQGELDSNIGLTLHHFQLKAKSKEDAEKLDAAFGIPVNQSLQLLRSKDDSISLDIPVTGDVSNPSFNPMDAIVKATSKAATFTLITFYTPYGLAYAGGNVLFDLATAMRFDPVLFEPGSAELDPSATEQLDKLAMLMQERPQIHLTFCGKTNHNDLLALFPALAPKEQKPSDEEKEDKAGAPAVPLTATQAHHLEVLGQTRQEVAKDHMVEQKQIAHERIILCAPEYSDDEDAVSGIEINI